MLHNYLKIRLPMVPTTRNEGLWRKPIRIPVRRMEPMEETLKLIDEEIARLQQARDLLITAGAAPKKAAKQIAKRAAKKKRILSPEGRARIAAAAKARWAAQKKANK
jgi:hypothetical protein